MLRTDDVSIHYGAISAVSDFSMEVDGGEVVSIIGANGAGKSTLLNAIGGFLLVSSGTISLDGQPLGRADVGERVDRGIALVQEGRQIWRDLTVHEHLRLGAYTRRRRQDAEPASGDTMEFVLTLFPRIAERLRQEVGTLSGGEQQMVVIARALMSRPRVLLLDEPTLGLAPIVIDRIGEALEELRSPDLAVVVAEQDAAFALSISDRAYVMEVGECRVTGPAEDLRNDPQLVAAYLGVG